MSIRTAVVGLGYWGPNLARNVASSPAFSLEALVDPVESCRARVAAQYLSARVFESLSEALGEVALDLVCIATPVSSHRSLAIEAIEAGCHVLIEKPLAASLAEARKVLEAAEAQGVRVFVDHTFLFASATEKLEKLVADGSLGEIFFVDSVRINLGLFQPDVDVVWDLAPHDLSILNFALGAAPVAVRALGSAHNPKGLADDAHLHLEYSNGSTAHLHLSWLSPVKVRRMILAGSRRFAIWDDLEPMEKVRIYDHGVRFDVQDLESKQEVLVSYRRGDMVAPNLTPREALAVELENVADVLAARAAPIAPGIQGAAVVATLEAASKSLAADGARVAVEEI